MKRKVRMKPSTRGNRLDVVHTESSARDLADLRVGLDRRSDAEAARAALRIAAWFLRKLRGGARLYVQGADGRAVEAALPEVQR